MSAKSEKWHAKESVQSQQRYTKTNIADTNNNISAIENLNTKNDNIEQNSLNGRKSNTLHYDEFTDNNLYNNRSTKSSISNNENVVNLGQQNSDSNTALNEKNNTSRFLQFFGKTNSANKISSCVNGGTQYYPTSSFQPQSKKNVSSNCLDEFFRQALLNSQCKYKSNFFRKLENIK